MSTNQNTVEQVLKADELVITWTTAPRSVPDEQTAFQSDVTICTDHMISVDWTAANGWSKAELKPYQPLSLDPTAGCLHYALQCFEGMKVYRGHDGRLRLFRPDLNGTRMTKSAARVALPAVDPAMFVKLVSALVAADGAKWLPKDRAGSFLYLRPAIIGTQAQLGVRAAQKATFFIIMSFAAPLDDIPGGMQIATSPTHMIRAWEGGFGHAKIGSNYGPSVPAQERAIAQGFQQVLWLYGKDRLVTEVGGCNFFLIWKLQDGRNELITAPVETGLILDGVIRRSVLQLARERLSEDLVVSERPFSMAEILVAYEEGRILEAFGCGTAYFVTPFSFIQDEDKGLSLPMGDDGVPGTFTGMIKRWIQDIIYGRSQHEWAYLVEES